jgi:hypothetical protein
MWRSSGCKPDGNCKSREEWNQSGQDSLLLYKIQRTNKHYKLITNNMNKDLQDLLENWKNTSDEYGSTKSCTTESTRAFLPGQYFITLKKELKLNLLGMNRKIEVTHGPLITACQGDYPIVPNSKADLINVQLGFAKLDEKLSADVQACLQAISEKAGETLSS